MSKEINEDKIIKIKEEIIANIDDITQEIHEAYGEPLPKDLEILIDNMWMVFDQLNGRF